MSTFYSLMAQALRGLPPYAEVNLTVDHHPVQRLMAREPLRGDNTDQVDRRFTNLSSGTEWFIDAAGAGLHNVGAARFEVTKPADDFGLWWKPEDVHEMLAGVGERRSPLEIGATPGRFTVYHGPYAYRVRAYPYGTFVRRTDLDRAALIVDEADLPQPKEA